MIKTKELNLYLELLIQFLKITNALSIEYTNTLARVLLCLLLFAFPVLLV